MAGYFGTEIQQRLQAQAEKSADFIARTPGACQAGRTMGCDDPKQFGWGRISEIVQRDGVCGFRLIGTDDVPDIRSELESRACRFDTWDVFVAERDLAVEASRMVATQPLPAGLSVWATSDDPESTQIKDAQDMMATAGLVPFSGSMLTGQIGRSVTVIIGGESGVAATAHGYMPHNHFSSYTRYAWGGLVAVAEAHRGKGLGKLVNALMVERVFRELGATHVYELVSATNIPSRRMVEACGLRLEPTLTCGIATPQENARFTK
jgi:GNAT superfamily N-acetyltransferase